MNPFSDKKMISSWSKNIIPWTRTIDNNEIESKVGLTNKAILMKVINRKQKNILKYRVWSELASSPINNKKALILLVLM